MATDKAQEARSEEIRALLAQVPPGPQPVEMTAAEIREHLAAGEEVWLWEKDTPQHRVHAVDPLTVDHTRMGADFTIHFRGAMTGLMCGLQVSRDRVLKVMTRPAPQ